MVMVIVTFAYNDHKQKQTTVSSGTKYSLMMQYLITAEYMNVRVEKLQNKLSYTRITEYSCRTWSVDYGVMSKLHKTAGTIRT